jgi:hypothetical protein
VLKGVDAVAFVADSQLSMVERNRESFENLIENLIENGYDPAKVPIVIQLNKRDLPNVASVGELVAAMGVEGYPIVEAIANRGDGVFETLKTIVKLTLSRLRLSSTRVPSAGVERPAPPPPLILTTWSPPRHHRHLRHAATRVRTPSVPTVTRASSTTPSARAATAATDRGGSKSSTWRISPKTTPGRRLSRAGIPPSPRPAAAKVSPRSGTDGSNRRKPHAKRWTWTTSRRTGDSSTTSNWRGVSEDAAPASAEVARTGRSN